MLYGDLSITALIELVREEITGQSEDSISLQFGSAFRQARYHLHHFGNKDELRLQALVAETMQQLIDKKRIDKFMDVIGELKRGRHDELLAGIKAAQITGAMQILCGRRSSFLSLGSIEAIVRLASCVADNPELASAFKTEVKKLDASILRDLGVVLAGRLETGHLYIEDETLQNIILHTGLKPESVYDHVGKRWDRIPLVPEDAIQESVITARVDVIGNTNPYFPRLGRTLQVGDAISPAAFKLECATGYDVQDVYIGEVVSANEALKRAEDHKRDAAKHLHLRTARAMGKVAAALREIIALDPEAEVIWREKHHGDLPGFICPQRDYVCVIPEGQTAPYRGGNLHEQEFHSPQCRAAAKAAPKP